MHADAPGRSSLKLDAAVLGESLQVPRSPTTRRRIRACVRSPRGVRRHAVLRRNGGRVRKGCAPWPRFPSRSSFAVRRRSRSTSESRPRRLGYMMLDLLSRLLLSISRSTITRPRRPSAGSGSGDRSSSTSTATRCSGGRAGHRLSDCRCPVLVGLLVPAAASCYHCTVARPSTRWSVPLDPSCRWWNTGLLRRSASIPSCRFRLPCSSTCMP